MVDQVYDQVDGGEGSVATSDPTYMEVGARSNEGDIELQENSAYTTTVDLQRNEAYGTL